MAEPRSDPRKQESSRERESPRKPESSREAFLRATAELLQRQGYSATAVNEIVARSGAPKGSLYFLFPGGKEELAIAAMARSGERLRRGGGGGLDSGAGPGGAPG